MHYGVRRYKMDNYKKVKSAKWHEFEGVKDGIVLIYADGQQWSVPLDPDNTDYRAVQAWVAEGNKIEDAD